VHTVDYIIIGAERPDAAGHRLSASGRRTCCCLRPAALDRASGFAFRSGLRAHGSMTLGSLDVRDRVGSGVQWRAQLLAPGARYSAGPARCTPWFTFGAAQGFEDWGASGIRGWSWSDSASL